MPTNDGSRWPGRFPSNSDTTPRNCSRPQEVAAVLQATTARPSGTRSPRERTSRSVAGRRAAYHANFATLTACVANA